MIWNSERQRITVKLAYPQLLASLRTLMHYALAGNITSQCWYGTFYRWFEQDLELWETEQTALHHLQAFGGMGSFNDLVPDKDFPGGEEAFSRFYTAYRLLKELSFLCAQLWEEYRKESPDRTDGDVLINFTGVPVTICTCPSGHRWMKENFNISFYAHHANSIAEMAEGFMLVSSLGGEKAVAWLLENDVSADSQPVLAAMRKAVADFGAHPKPKSCNDCRKGRVECELLYMTGWPLTLSKEHFIIEPG